MKRIEQWILLFVLSAMLSAIVSCKKDNGDRSPVSTDGTKPGVVTSVNVSNYNGGAYITYKLPNSDNLLYVLAKYNIRNGVSRETKASLYTDTLNVEGFAKEADYTVTLYSVSRANVMSDPVTVTVHPKTPPYLLTRAALNMQADFGGVNIQTLDQFKKSLGVIITAYDTATNKMQIQDQHYTTDSTINYSVRGYQSVARSFGVYVTDNFGNISDTLKLQLTPIFEQLLDKSKFSLYTLPSDSQIGFGWTMPYIWDGNTDPSSTGWATLPGGTPPFVGTFSVGASYKLSRFVLWEKPDSDLPFSYEQGNPKIFAIWGSNAAAPKDAQLPVSAPVGTVLGDWVNIGNYTFPDPPSGLPPIRHNAADNAIVAAGVNFNIPLSAPSVRYVRFATSETWSGGSYSHILELSLYGQPQ